MSSPGISRVPARFGALDPQRRFASRGPLDYLGALGESTLWGAFNLFGFDEPERVRMFRRDEPIGGFASDILGFSIPYMGMAKLSRLPKAAKLLGRVTGGIKNPVLQGAAQEVLRMAPLEVAKLGVSTTLAGKPLDERLGDTAWMVGIEAVAGGAFGGFRHLGKRSKRIEDYYRPGFDLGSSKGMQLRELGQGIRDKVKAGEKVSPEYYDMYHKLNLAVRQESPIGAARLSAIRSVDGETLETIISGSRPMPHILKEFESIGGRTPNRDQLKFLLIEDARLPSARKGGIHVYKPIVDPHSRFPDLASLEEVIVEATPAGAFKKPLDIFEFLYYPAYVEEVVPKSGKSFMDKLLRDNLTHMGKGRWHGREIDGMDFVALQVPLKIRPGESPMSRRLASLDPTKYTAPGDKRGWLVGLTPETGKLMPESAAWNEIVNAKTAWARVPGVRQAGAKASMYDDIDAYLNDKEIINWDEMIRLDPTEKGRFAKAAERLGLDKHRDSAVVHGVKEAMDLSIRPREFMLKERPLARALLRTVRYTEDLRKAKHEKLIFGLREMDPKKGTFMAATRGKRVADPDSVHTRIGELKTQADRDAFVRLEGTPLENLKADDDIVRMLERGEISGEVFRAVRADRRVSGILDKELSSTERIVGNELTTLKADRGSLSRGWEGTHRVEFKDEAGLTKHMEGGFGAKDAERRARIVMDEFREQGKNYVKGKPFLANRAHDAGIYTQMEQMRLDGNVDFMQAQNIVEQLSRKARAPLTLKRRTEVGGYITEYKTNTDLMHSITQNIKARVDYIAEMSLNSIKGPHLENLFLYGDEHAIKVIQRNQDTAFHRAGPFGKLINRGAEAIVGHIFGPNVASRIARKANETQMHLSLGGFNWGYSAIAALTFMQTVLPEVSWVLNASPKNLARAYSTVIVFDAAGNPIRRIHALSVEKIMRQSAKELAEPSALLRKHHNIAMGDGTIEMMPETIAKYDQSMLRMKETLKDPKKWWKYIVQQSEHGMSYPERASRIHSFTIGHILGRDLVGMADDELYMFAKQFTDRTMYRYAASDKARSFVGPVGTVFGLFKHWALSYMFNTARYAGAGFKYGNWKPLLWQVAGTAALGGVGIVPMYVPADNFSRFASNEPLMEHIYRTFSGDEGDDTLSDAIYFGLPSLLRASLSAQAQAPFYNPARDATMIWTFVHMDRMAMAAKAIGEAGEFVTATGDWNPLKSPRVRDVLARTLLPKTAYRLMALRTGQLRSLRTGYPLVKDLSLTEQLMYTFGLNPVRVERVLRTSHEMWEDMDLRKERTGAYGKAWADAEARGDWATIREIYHRAIAEGLDPSSIASSAATRLYKGEVDIIERTHGLAERWRRRYSLGLR